MTTSEICGVQPKTEPHKHLEQHQYLTLLFASIIILLTVATPSTELLYFMQAMKHHHITLTSTTEQPTYQSLNKK